MKTLGRLKRVPLREAWIHEASDFTPWLALPENLEALGEVLGTELELEAQEQNVGAFRADILCKDLANDSWVLIENQLEKTNHGHLGSLLTYAAGLQAVTIVWIAAEFAEPHRATLDWLNEITDERFRFFGLEVELWQIADSPPAPKFNIVSKPNDFSKDVASVARRLEDQPLTDTQKKYLDYWTMFNARLRSAGGMLRPQKPFPQHWMNFSVGRSGSHLSGLLNSTEKRIGVEVHFGSRWAKSDFEQLFAQKKEIEDELGFGLEWLPLPNRKACRLVNFRDDADPLDESKWDEFADWMEVRLRKLNEVFRPRIKLLQRATEAKPSSVD